MKKPLVYALAAVICGVAVANFNSFALDTKGTTAPGEYMTIVYSGRLDTHVIFGDGKAQFFPELANPTRIERVDDRILMIHTLINRYAKEGYEYVDTPEINRVIMRKR